MEGKGFNVPKHNECVVVAVMLLVNLGGGITVAQQPNREGYQGFVNRGHGTDKHAKTSTKLATLQSEIEGLGTPISEEPIELFEDGTGCIECSVSGGSGFSVGACKGGGCGGNCGCSSHVGLGECGCGGDGGWQVGVQYVLVKPHFDAGVDTIAVAVENQLQNGQLVIQLDNGFDYEGTPRVWLGYSNCCGNGARIRYWSFDHSAERTPYGIVSVGESFAVLDASLNVQALDLEATKHLELCGTHLTLAGGLRYGKAETRRRFTYTDKTYPESNYFMDSRVDFDGVGPTVALEFRSPRHLFCKLDLIANVRGSLLYGGTDMSLSDFEVSEEYNEPLVFATTGSEEVIVVQSEDDDVVYVLETQVGTAYSIPWSCGSLSIQALFEGQLWGGATKDGFVIPIYQAPLTSSSSNTADNSIGFVGATFGLVYEQ